MISPLIYSLPFLGSLFLVNWHNTVSAACLLPFLHFEHFFPLRISFFLPLILVQLQEYALDKVSVPHVWIYLVYLDHAHRHILLVPGHLQLILSMHGISDRLLLHVPNLSVYAARINLLHCQSIIAQLFAKFRHWQQNVRICLRLFLNQLLFSLAQRILDF